MKIYFKALLVLTVIGGCCNTQSRNKLSVILPNNLTNLEILCPRDLIMVDSFLVILNPCYDPIFQILNTKSGEIKLFGKKGKGPNEFINVLNLTNDIRKGIFYILDVGKKEIFYLSPSKLFSNQSPIINKTKLPDKYNITGDLFYFRKTWIGTDLSGKSSMFFINETTGQEKEIGFLPNVRPVYPEQTRSYLYRANAKIDAQKGKILTALNYFPIIRIINSTGDIEKEFITQENYLDPVLNKNKGFPVGTTPLYYFDVESTENSIFVLNANCTQQDLQNNDFSKSQIDVFNWKGNLQTTIKSNTPIGNFTLDPEENKIYALSINSPEVIIIEMQIPDSLAYVL